MILGSRNWLEQQKMPSRKGWILSEFIRDPVAVISSKTPRARPSECSNQKTRNLMEDWTQNGQSGCTECVVPVVSEGNKTKSKIDLIASNNGYGMWMTMLYSNWLTQSHTPKMLLLLKWSYIYCLIITFLVL